MRKETIIRAVCSTVRRWSTVLCSMLFGVLALQPPAASAALPIAAFEVDATHVGGDFSLVDQRGNVTGLGDFAGKVVILVFGYAGCPDVCPATLSRLARERQALGPAAERVQVVFTSIDPERDSPERLGEYVEYFDPTFVALTGTPTQLAQVTSRYDVHYRIQPETAGGEYTVEHSVYGYLIDTQGRARYSFPFDIERELLAEGIERLLEEDSAGGQADQVYCEQRIPMTDDFATTDSSDWSCAATEGRAAWPLGTSGLVCQ
jgi:protein SCO1/2